MAQVLSPLIFGDFPEPLEIGWLKEVPQITTLRIFEGFSFRECYFFV